MGFTKMNKQIDTIVVGELNVDLILNKIHGFPKVGTEILADDMDLTLGSSSAIFASNISTLGVKTAFIGKIGSDSFGDLVIETLASKNVDTSLIQLSSTNKTGATIVLNFDNDRAMVTHPGAMEDLSESEIKDTDLERARHMHVSSIFLQPALKKGIVSLFQRAKNLGLTTSLDMQWDPAEKWDVDFNALLPLVDVFLPNNNEINAITGKKTVEESLAVLGPYANIIAVKLGHEGSMCYKKEQTLFAKPFLNENVVDAIGAGDSFNAGFLSAYLQGLSMEDCLERGNIIGAINTTGVGGTGAFASMDEVRKTAQQKFSYQI